ncbi:ABC transporter substrate-binding protein [Azospirillum picis]|uniref:NitT/TauT family transport system substrate-binding protein n=1 Tax=Azospirillum picis TaxID=488438 RepID=A0ABU0MNN3_9PROT|nr:ABC transporter substrate-binding protein [Azospirillum picis]MBP2301758.1 NitT/TauT family transport system substrate-binding protein [Azospirillum picis]MDQ0535067.1 NitT/TauT family transport system substrate-binding protein [Azospirillum picis]
MKTPFAGYLRRAAALGFAIGLAALSGLATAGPALAMDKVTVAGWSQPISEITNLLAEPDKGFFKARDIALDYVPGTGGGSAIQTLLTGQANVAFTDPASFFLALDKGQKLVAIYNIYPQNVFNVVSPKERNITRPADLKGRRVGVYSLSSGTYQNLLVLLHQAGLSEKDVTIEVTGLLNFAPVIQGQVDATAATDTGLHVGLQKGLKDVNVIEVKDSLNLPSDIFVVTAETYATRKDLLKRFLAGYRDSAAWMIAQPEEAARIAVTRAINGRDEATNLAIITLRNASSQSETTRATGLGSFDPALMQQGADSFRQLGLIAGPIDIAKVVATDLIPAPDGKAAAP